MKTNTVLLVIILFMVYFTCVVVIYDSRIKPDSCEIAITQTPAPTLTIEPEHHSRPDDNF